MFPRRQSGGPYSYAVRLGRCLALTDLMMSCRFALALMGLTAKGVLTISIVPGELEQPTGDF